MKRGKTACHRFQTIIVSNNINENGFTSAKVSYIDNQVSIYAFLDSYIMISTDHCR